MNSYKRKIELIDLRISKLPKGTLIYKTINNIKQPYLQQTVNGKGKTTFIKKANREQVIKEIELREQLKKRRDELEREYAQMSNLKKNLNSIIFKTNVLLDEDLEAFANSVSKYKYRFCFENIQKYFKSDEVNKVLVLYGLRRTGKTTLIKQTILSLCEEEKEKTAYIQISANNTMAELKNDLELLYSSGFRNVFIDEITKMPDFIDGGALLADIYVSRGMKILLSGTDSLGFYIAKKDSLYDRAILIHTTYISYHEFETVLGIKGIDTYICYGGTMSIEGKHYNNDYMDKDNYNIDEYIDSSISHNIQHSLKNYEFGTHFRNLEKFYNSGELTNIINRVIEDINHRFTIQVINSKFKSTDLGISQKNLRNDRDFDKNPLDYIDSNEFLNNLKSALEIIEENEQKNKVDENIVEAVKEYLFALDIFKTVNIEYLPVNEINKLNVITQPGIRYSQGKLLLDSLLKDKNIQKLSSEQLIKLTNRILNEIRGRMMEEIVLLETSLKTENAKVIKLQFLAGEFDMLIYHYDSNTCEIFEVKHSDQICEEQYHHLIDDEKIKMTEEKYGKVVSKNVIYRGKEKTLPNKINYINVESYLNNLYNN